MKVLIIGGTRFVGRHIVEAALQRGHTLTLFNRGQSGPDLFPDVEQVHGDRTRDLSLLQGRSWDAVIDTCGYIPGVVRASARFLAPTTNHYTFISTLSVYGDLAATHGDFSREGMDETAPVAELEPGESTEEVALPTYGALKALCEQEVEEAMPGRSLVVRCGLVVGPHDTSDRFTYWVRRIAEGGDVLAPGSPEAPVQLIDARDLATWTVRMVERGATGVFNTTGPLVPVTMRDVLLTCRDETGSQARFTWVSDAFLDRMGVGQYVEMPLWVRHRPKTAGFSAVSIERARAAGLQIRPLAETVRDVLAWDRGRPEREAQAGLPRDRELALLQAWHEQ